MKWLTFEIQREPGFRFNLIDLILLLAVAAAALALQQVSPGSHLIWLPPYVGFSFFLFCNVFRIGNRMEVFWYVPFLTLALCAHGYPNLFWPLILLVCEPLKVVLVVLCFVRGKYRGVLFERSQLMSARSADR